MRPPKRFLKLRSHWNHQSRVASLSGKCHGSQDTPVTVQTSPVATLSLIRRKYVAANDGSVTAIEVRMKKICQL